MMGAKREGALSEEGAPFVMQSSYCERSHARRVTQRACGSLVAHRARKWSLANTIHDRRRNTLTTLSLPSPHALPALVPRPLVRLLVVTNDFPPRVGGINDHVHQLLLRLGPAEITVFSSTHPGAAAFDATVPH